MTTPQKGFLGGGDNCQRKLLKMPRNECIYAMQPHSLHKNKNRKKMHTRSKDYRRQPINKPSQPSRAAAFRTHHFKRCTATRSRMHGCAPKSAHYFFLMKSENRRTPSTWTNRAMKPNGHARSSPATVMLHAALKTFVIIW